MRGEPDMAWWFLKTMIRKGRTTTNQSQQRIADRIYRSRDTIAAWENGRTSIPASAIGPLAEACGLSREIAEYMQKVAHARQKGLPVEADARLNALILALAEEYCGFIFKWDALIIPGPAQTKNYHYLFTSRMKPGTSDQQLDTGWSFKTERFTALTSRMDDPTIQLLIGQAALLILRVISEELYWEQIAHLRHCSSEFGWEIRILTDPVFASQSNFDIIKSGDSSGWCPSFVYTEVHDSSWCIEVPERIESYDDFRNTKWNSAIRIEDTRYDE